MRWCEEFLAASSSAQRSVWGPWRDRNPPARRRSEEESTVTSRPVWRTACSDREKRRQSPNSDHTATAISPPMPYWASTNAVHAGCLVPKRCSSRLSGWAPVSLARGESSGPAPSHRAARRRVWQPVGRWRGACKHRDSRPWRCASRALLLVAPDQHDEWPRDFPGCYPTLLPRLRAVALGKLAVEQFS